MIELNALIPTLTPLNGPDLFSLIPALPTLEAPVTVESINTSAPIEQNFSALLTEMMGTGEGPQKAQTKPETQEHFEIRNSNFEIPFVHFVVNSPVVENERGLKPATTEPVEDSPKPEQKYVVEGFSPRPLKDAAIWADVKKFELTVRNEMSVRQPQPQPQPQSQPPTPTAEPTKPSVAMVTSDPVVNAQQPQLPLRVIAIEKVAIQTRLHDGAGEEPEAPAASRDSAAPPAVQFSEVARMPETVVHVEQARPAHHVEMPNAPHVQVVRTVALEVGEADSQVVIRIQERGGDVQLQFSAAGEPLRRDLQSSVGSLIHALRREDIQVSSVEVSKKSPIVKVRRMKEAH